MDVSATGGKRKGKPSRPSSASANTPPFAPHTSARVSLDDDVRTALVVARKVGASLRSCAGVAGIALPTLHQWLRMGRAGDERYASLAAEMDAAIGGVERTLHERVMDATIDDGRLALDALEYLTSAELRRARVSEAKAKAKLAKAAAAAVDRGDLSARLVVPSELLTPRTTHED